MKYGTKVFVSMVVLSSILILTMISRIDMINLAGQIARKVARNIGLNNASDTNINDEAIQPKIVLVYTPYFGDIPWQMPGMDSPALKFTHFDGKSCPYTCLITYNRSNLAYCDGVLFHNRDLPSVEHLKKITLNRTLQQRWMIFGLESPRYVPAKVMYLNGIFNWTMLYTRDADIFSTYGLYRNLTPNEIPTNHSQTNYAKGKDRLVAWSLSHCGTTRDRIVSKLTEFIPVSIYGSCASRFPKRSNLLHTQCPRNTQQCSNIFRKFKFYLSFENALCTDYITEKYWETPFFHDMVPIVFGSNYDAKNSIPGSYINVLDFPSIKALADYIKYLDKNDTAYNEYFQWKAKYQRTDPNWMCELCAKLHNAALPTKVHTNLKAVWGEEHSCSHNENKLVNKLIHGETD